MTDFFGAPNLDGLGSGADAKLANAVGRKYTSHLHSTEPSYVLEWLQAAMDLQYQDGVVNLRWDNGKALRDMWEEILAKDLPSDDRCKNEIPDMKTRDEYSLHATYTVATSSQGLYRTRDDPVKLSAHGPLKRSRTHSTDDGVTETQPQKRTRTTRKSQKGKQPRTEGQLQTRERPWTRAMGPPK